MKIEEYKGWVINFVYSDLKQKGEFYISKGVDYECKYLVLGEVQHSMYHSEKKKYGYLNTYQECVDMIDAYENRPTNRKVAVEVDYDTANQILMFKRNLSLLHFNKVPEFISFCDNLMKEFEDDDLGFDDNKHLKHTTTETIYLSKTNCNVG